MKLTLHTDYALRVLLYLAGEPQRHASVAEIAEAYAISYNHLTKVVHRLVRDGYLSSIRGRSGGVMLAVDAAQLKVGQLVREMEGDEEPAACPTCPLMPACGLRDALCRAMDAFYAVLDDYTLADMLDSTPALSFLPHR